MSQTQQIIQEEGPIDFLVKSWKWILFWFTLLCFVGIFTFDNGKISTFWGVATVISTITVSGSWNRVIDLIAKIPGLFMLALKNWKVVLPSVMCTYALCVWLNNNLTTKLFIVSILSILIPLFVHFKWYNKLWTILGSAINGGFKKYPLESFLVLIGVISLAIIVVAFTFGARPESSTLMFVGGIGLFGSGLFLVWLAGRSIKKALDPYANKYFGIEEKKK